MQEHFGDSLGHRLLQHGQGHDVGGEGNLGHLVLCELCQAT